LFFIKNKKNIKNKIKEEKIIKENYKIKK